MPSSSTRGSSMNREGCRWCSARKRWVSLLDAAQGLKYKAALSVAYGAGLRASEVVSLKISDIDSKRMLVRVEQGKGRKGSAHGRGLRDDGGGEWRRGAGSRGEGAAGPHPDGHSASDP